MTYYVRNNGVKRGGSFKTLNDARKFAIESLYRSNPEITPDLEVTDAKLNQLGCVLRQSYMYKPTGPGPIWLAENPATGRPKEYLLNWDGTIKFKRN